MLPNTRHVAVIVPPYQCYDRGLVDGIAAFVKQSHQKWSVYLEDDPRIRLPHFEKWDGDGIITNFNNQKVIQSLGRKNLPVVGLGGGYVPIEEKIPYAYVGTDQRDTARLGFEHLYALGLRRFAYCGEPLNRHDHWSEERGNAFRAYANEAGCHCDVFITRLSTRLGAWTRVQECIQKWISTLAPPVGLMASCDRRARHVLEACRKSEVRVPEDFAVLGVDNDHLLCSLSAPSLSSVELNTHQIGYEGAKILDQMMSGEQVQDQFTVVKARSVVARQSTDMLAVDDEEIADAIRFIRKHACDSINVGNVLELIPLSRSTLENRFKQLFGRSVHAEIRRLQIEEAKKLLAETDLSLTMVASRIGINSIQYFTTLMRQETGSTPAKFRRQARKDSSDNL